MPGAILRLSSTAALATLIAAAALPAIAAQPPAPLPESALGAPSLSAGMRPRASPVATAAAVAASHPEPSAPATALDTPSVDENGNLTTDISQATLAGPGGSRAVFAETVQTLTATLTGAGVTAGFDSAQPTADMSGVNTLSNRVVLDGSLLFSGAPTPGR